jgi:methyl-accepting chemotaxis protein
MLKFKTIKAELITYLATSLALILMIVAYFYIERVQVNSKLKAELGLSHALTIQSRDILTFFEKHALVVDTFLSNPAFVNWFDLYTTRDSDLSSDKTYPNIIEQFKNLSLDKETKAVFFASARTGEYFDNNNGRYGTDNYDARKRPWWGEALKQNKMFVTQPEEDFVDKTIVTSVKTTVFNQQNELIGIAGVDILISTIKEKVNNDLKYENIGNAFLINRDGRVIIFPDSNDLIKVDSHFKKIDEKIDDASGFSNLFTQLTTKNKGITSVTWQGTSHLVAFNRIKSEEPYLDWVAGIMVPSSVVTSAVNSSITQAITVSVFILLIVIVIVLLITQKIISPLKSAVNAIASISKGEGDLTKRLTILSNNEASQFSMHFNAFIDHIHKVLSLTKEVVDSLAINAQHISEITQKSSSQAIQQRDATDMAATAAEQLSYSIRNVSEGTLSANTSATEAETQIKEGVSIVNQSTDSIQILANTISQIEGIVDNLDDDSNKIGSVLEVIQGIAEQTNLLALNAAIEAARAGDKGRGFAVVADEVRNLASKTQESTLVIEEIINNLQKSSKQVVEAVSHSAGQAQLGVNHASKVQQVLTGISQSIIDIQMQSSSIASATHEQANASQEITEQASSIRELSETNETDVAEILKETQLQEQGIKKLTQLVNQFKL